MPISTRILKFFASLRLAVFIILALAIVSAVGTITEARFNDAEVANKLVYQSPWMYAVLGLLIITLIAVMIDRWPWKQHHAGFVLAHIGIIVLLFGAWLTQQYGLDGSMAFEIGENRNLVMVKDRDLMVFASIDGGEPRAIYERPADFLRNPPTPEAPFVVNVGSDKLTFTEHHQFAFREADILPTENAGDLPAIRFQLENANVNLTQWLRGERGSAKNEVDLGPAKIVLANSVPAPSGRNEVILIPPKNGDRLEYVIYNADKSLKKKGQVRQSETIETGWMGLKLRLLRFLPHAMENVRYVPNGYFTEMTTSAAKFSYAGQDYWVGLNAPLRIFGKDRAIIVVYGNRQIPLRFGLSLEAFRMDKYQGTNRPATYESDVTTPDRRKITISMNEPLKYDGYTFYQSSYQMNERGEPTISVLSVNKDPGRWVKYLGSMLIVLGSVILFYFKRVKWIKPKGSV